MEYVRMVRITAEVDTNKQTIIKEWDNLNDAIYWLKYYREQGFV